ncbi:hypothetical protein PanWU01x14_241260 [Parasponia andersonii]|uniref:Uncharacterized protein n=1 Tax=Parasponia andersonii TaxID=3476 RepID=A0A2P5BGH1_PARAD|nr:hypothetical protein PanWU01x14_241260 [Parasponia andersonii]
MEQRDFFYHKLTLPTHRKVINSFISALNCFEVFVSIVTYATIKLS